MGHQRRPDEADPGAPEQRRRRRAGKLLVVDRDLGVRRGAPAVLHGPVDADPPSVVERVLPFAEHVGVRDGRCDLHAGGRMPLQPGPQLGPERRVLRRHRPSRLGAVHVGSHRSGSATEESALDDVRGGLDLGRGARASAEHAEQRHHQHRVEIGVAEPARSQVARHPSPTPVE